MRIVGNTKLVWDGQQQSVRLGDCLIFPKLFDKRIRLGSAVVELREQMANIVVDNILAVLAGRPPPNCVNPEVYAEDGERSVEARS